VERCLAEKNGSKEEQIDKKNGVKELGTGSKIDWARS